MEYKAIGDHIVIKAYLKKTAIILPDVKKNEKAGINYSVDKTEVWAIGEKVKLVNPKDRVIVDDGIFRKEIFINKILGRKENENERYFRAKEEDILGVVK